MSDIIEQKEYIKEIFRDVLLEVIREERINFYHSIIPTATKEEIQEIEKNYGKPSDYKDEDFVDMTDRVTNAC